MTSTAGDRWTARPDHRRWLAREADDLLRLFETESLDPAGGFFALDAQGRAIRDDDLREIHVTTRMVHCYAVAALMGRPGAMEIVDHGLRFLREHHRRPEGGYAWGVTATAAPEPRFTGYGHAFVLLAAASAKLAGHPRAQETLDDVTAILRERFWEEEPGAIREAFDAEWREIDAYRGQNCNMHLTEALMAAFEATGDARHLEMAERIAELIVNRRARENGWRLAEHFHADWRVDRNYAGDPMFRPAGLTPGHSLEWARLLVQLWETGGRRLDWAPEAARALFDRAVADGWDADKGGLYYTLGWDDRPDVAERYWWPVCEGIGAAHALSEIEGDPRHEDWYRRFWDFAARRLIDRDHGGWHPQIDAAGRPSSDPFFGKPDLYHALQACLIPLHPVTGSLAHLLAQP
ncbi:AGE family epimerase/isomerase [Limimaricola pyoseonensis]|uniref:Mannose or cellobiose epimerase, N-acyl-D-glucosamine 2-epimerase family n=1 Tax=Limimaricola pyoseonensis TaxID=521013 RepID=A0A1G7FS63_9RHOB|nr:AGE family epimerase/isomerase [Limimaricola pyoseonensis]SDE78704.1 Mannose or cellobiose epimerase, N-acyl-D-glucosamine 2-epimerase family [Limimaricola pyoseonensis]